MTGGVLSDYYNAIKVLKSVFVGDKVLAAGNSLLAEVVLIVQTDTMFGGVMAILRCGF